jgi:uncharacterized protein
MALQLRPNCEYCDKDLPPSATDARICSYECTFCADKRVHLKYSRDDVAAHAARVKSIPPEQR